jgi:hypothetical protein
MRRRVYFLTSCIGIKAPCRITLEHRQESVRIAARAEPLQIVERGIGRKLRGVRRLVLERRPIFERRRVRGKARDVKLRRQRIR